MKPSFPRHAIPVSASRALRHRVTSCPQASLPPSQRPHLHRRLHLSPALTATPVAHPLVPGRPPKPPVAQTSPDDERLVRKKKNAQLLDRARSLPSASTTSSSSSTAPPSSSASPLQRRFWKDVCVRETPDGYHVFLDSRSVRTPSKHVLTIPSSKPHLATAVALEWDLLVSAQQATKNHYIPLTSLLSRATDIANADLQGDSRLRDSIVNVAMRYLTTDTLLCWAPEHNLHEPEELVKRRFIEESATLPSSSFSSAASSLPPLDASSASTRPTLRAQQEAAAKPIVAHLTSHVWPGVQLQPALPEGTILPVPQPEETTSVIQGWVTGLSPYDLAGLERAILASKSLCVATRLVVEWSEAYTPKKWLDSSSASHEQRFTVEDAALACSQEVKWQTSMWGEVEDTHDVENEDLRRQLGSVVLLVNGASAA